MVYENQARSVKSRCTVTGRRIWGNRRNKVCWVSDEYAEWWTQLLAHIFPERLPGSRESLLIKGCKKAKRLHLEIILNEGAMEADKFAVWCRIASSNPICPGSGLTDIFELWLWLVVPLYDHSARHRNRYAWSTRLEDTLYSGLAW